MRPWNSRKSLGFILRVMGSLVSYVMMVSLNGVALIHVIKLSDYSQEMIISRIRGELLQSCSPLNLRAGTKGNGRCPIGMPHREKQTIISIGPQ